MRQSRFPSPLPPCSGRSTRRRAVAAPVAALLCVGLLAALLFVRLSLAVRHQETRQFDRSVLRAVRTRTASVPRAVVRAASLPGAEPVVAVIGLAVCATFALRRRWLDAFFMAGAVGGYVILAVATKNILQQERPVDLFRIPDTQYRFPSGHTLGATCLALALGNVLWRGQSRRGVKALGTVGLVGVVLGVGASRMMLNLHNPTDVAGGVLLGTAWMSALIAGRLLLEDWQRSRDAEEFAP